MRRRLAGLTTLSMRLWLLGVIACSFSTEANAANSPPAMIVPGQFNVSATGAATYNIPIAVPPGSAGMVPALSLGYSSQSGNGIAGIGWTLSGLPSISRCPRTMAQDSGVHGSVNYDTYDRFCMEGQRLIYVTGGSGYGTDASQYRTEVESFSEIIEHNAINSSNVWFEVHTKSGQIMQFGNTTDSQILTIGLSTNVVRAWAVNQITDTVGNYLTVTYNCTPVSGACTDSDRTTYGEAYPLQINYTGNAAAGVSPYNSVTFSYQCKDGAGTCRGDTAPMYQAGALTQTTVLLTDIKTYQGANLVSDYQLAYREGTTTTNSRLTSVTLCDNASHCLAPTTFGWQGGTGYETLSSGTSETVAQDQLLIPAGFSGTGIPDALPLPGNVPCSSYPTFPGYAAPSYTTVSGSVSNALGTYDFCTFYGNTQTIVAPNGTSSVLALLEGDSSLNPTKYVAYVSNSQGVTQGVYTLSVGANPPPAFAGDFNGDGIVDILIQGTSTTQYYPGLSSGGFSTTGVSLGSFSPSTTALSPTDFDGDGCTDLYTQTSSSATVHYGCNPATSSASAPMASGYTPVFGDFNGDGKTDILLVSKTAPAQLWLSTGTGFTEVNSSVASGTTGSSDWGKYIVYVGDWKGEGKADILLVAPGTTGNYGSGTSHKLYVSTGTDLTPAVDSSNNPITISNSASRATAVPAGWSGTGATDIWIQQPTTAGGDTLHTFSYAPELMITISNGIGSTTNVSYAPLNTNGSLYTKGSSAVFPNQDIDGALYVVSRVDASNGLGTCNPATSYTNCYSSTYTYAGAQTNVQGRGFLGFFHRYNYRLADQCRAGHQLQHDVPLYRDGDLADQDVQHNDAQLHDEYAQQRNWMWVHGITHHQCLFCLSDTKRGCEQ